MLDAHIGPGGFVDGMSAYEVGMNGEVRQLIENTSIIAFVRL